MGSRLGGVLGVVLLICGAAAGRAADVASLKAYVVGEFVVTDPAGYKTYAAATSPIVAKFGGVYLVRGGRSLVVERPDPPGRTVVIAFPSLFAAQAFEASPEYLAVAPPSAKGGDGPALHC